MRLVGLQGLYHRTSEKSSRSRDVPGTSCQWSAHTYRLRRSTYQACTLHCTPARTCRWHLRASDTCQSKDLGKRKKHSRSLDCLGTCRHWRPSTCRSPGRSTDQRRRSHCILVRTCHRLRSRVSDTEGTRCTIWSHSRTRRTGMCRLRHQNRCLCAVRSNDPARTLHCSRARTSHAPRPRASDIRGASSTN